jgi:hypothetical protein
MKIKEKLFLLEPWKFLIHILLRLLMRILTCCIHCRCTISSVMSASRLKFMSSS